MAVKKASVKDLAEKAAAAKKADAKAEVKAEVKEEVKKAEVKAEAPKKEAAPAKKAVPAKKAPAKKATAAKANLFVQYQGGNVSTDDIVKKALEVSGKKTVKELNVYYQPENNIVYFTADGENGSFNY